MARVTIATISRYTKLSRGTVSRALNDRPDISQETKERVQEACRELNYVPSRIARQLATGRSHILTIVTGPGCGRLKDDFSSGFALRAESSGYGLKFLELHEVSDKPDKVSQVIAASDGVVVACHHGDIMRRELLELLAKKPHCFCNSIDSAATDRFDCDYRESGRLLANHLIDQVDHELLYLHNCKFDPRELRRTGFVDACKARSASVRVIDFSGEVQEIEDAVVGAKGIAASDDYTAVQAMLLAAYSGRRAGQDFVIGGQGNESIAATLLPPLTSVDHNGPSLGERAADTLIKRIEKQRLDAPFHEKICPSLLVRESSLLRSSRN